MQETTTFLQHTGRSSVSDLADLLLRTGWFYSPYFYAGLSLSAVALTIMYFYNRTAAIRRRHEYLELVNLQQQQLIDAQLEAQEAERKRIAKDLHDGVGTALTSVKLLVSDCLDGETSEQASKVKQVNERLSEIISEIKQIIYDLSPPALERYGLKAGIKNLVERTNQLNLIKIDYHFYGHRKDSPKTAVPVYRIVQELLNNTLKHARATRVRLQVHQFENELNLMYEDNGVGMNGNGHYGLGLGSIESRVQSLKGRLRFETNDQGTFYNVDIPLTP
jgi:signal transduction histidine kinase